MRLTGLHPRTGTIFAAILLPFMVALSFGFGATWDEKIQHEYGELVYRYFESGFRDRSALEYKDLYLYGGLFDLLCVLGTKLIPADPFIVRHVVNSAFGWIGVAYAGRLANLLFGPAAGLLAMVMLTLSPRYLGDAMNNPKDIPFAALATVATYYLATVERAYPYLNWKTALKLTLAIALAINVRAGGLLFLCYLAALLTLFLAMERPPRFAVLRRFAATAARFGLIALASVVLGTLFWPWAQAQPFVRPLYALNVLTHFYWPGSVLYRGQYFAATEIPWDYPFVYMFITSPPLVIAGVVLSSLVVLRGGWAGRRALGCWVVLFFPLIYVVVQGSMLYDGIRQLMFAYPPMVVVAAGGWVFALRAARRLLVPAVLLLAIGLAEPLIFQLRNHPNQIVYFNLFAGGPSGAFGRYDLDYWGASMLPAVKRSSEIATSASRDVLLSSGDPNDVVQADMSRFSNLIYAEKSAATSHLHIELLRGSPEQIAALLAAPTVHVVRTADGAPLCVIQPGPRYRELPSHPGL